MPMNARTITMAAALVSFAAMLTAIPDPADARGRGFHFHRHFHVEHSPSVQRHHHRWHKRYYVEPEIYVVKRKKQRIVAPVVKPEPESKPTPMEAGMDMPQKLTVMSCDDSGQHMKAVATAGR